VSLVPFGLAESDETGVASRLLKFADCTEEADEAAEALLPGLFDRSALIMGGFML
jgi:hypothetical protein